MSNLYAMRRKLIDLLEAGEVGQELDYAIADVVQTDPEGAPIGFAPMFTSDLQVVVNYVVPDELEWSVGSKGVDDMPWGSVTDGGSIYSAVGGNPAAALCAAALKWINMLEKAA